MTCQEMHCYLENPLRVEIYMYRESLPAAVSAHLAECRDCAWLFEEQKALGISLNMARDTAPQITASLDAKMLANYRRQMEEPESVGHRGRWTFSSTWRRWGVAAGVVAVITISLFLGLSRAPVTARKIAPVQTPNRTVQQQVPETPAKEPLAVKSPQQKGATKQVRTSAGVNRSPLPPGFVSLMYCDELSCTGAMEVIRVELPPAAGQVLGSAASTAMAEVLVGDDGIARGIRIVQ